MRQRVSVLDGLALLDPTVFRPQLAMALADACGFGARQGDPSGAGTVAVADGRRAVQILEGLAGITGYDDLATHVPNDAWNDLARA